MNEDYFLADPELGLYLVCDGMGGHASGEVASRMAATSVHAYLHEHAAELASIDEGGSSDRVVGAMRRALELASAEIYRHGLSEAGKKGMGTTCIALLVRGEKGYVAHVGDSRLYLLRAGTVHQLSEDHSFLQEALRHGLMTPEEAKLSQHKNIITRALGPLEHVTVDTLAFDVIEGDTFLLCSDGLHGYFEEASELLPFLEREDVDAIPEALIAIANERGGSDNVTAVVVRLREEVRETLPDTDGFDRALLVNQGIATIRHIQLFSELAMAELLRVSDACVSREVKADEVIIAEGDSSEALFLIVNGQMVVERHGKPVAILEAGAHFGEMALLSQRPRSATVRARTRADLLVLDRPAFFSILQRDPVLATKFLWRLAQTLSLRLDDFYELSDSNLTGVKTTLPIGLYPSPFSPTERPRGR